MVRTPSITRNLDRARQSPRGPVVIATLGACLLLGSLARSSAAAPHPGSAPPGPRPPGPATADHAPMPAEVRDAVNKALEWLAKSQKADGTWPTKEGYTTSIPSLAAMAFLAGGDNPRRDPSGTHSDVINKAVNYVLSEQRQNGALSRCQGSGYPYEHAISTLMLCRASGAVDDARRDRIDKALPRAVQWTVDAQNYLGKPKQMPYTGGWRYREESMDADLSVTCWQLEALMAAGESGVKVPPETLEAGRDFVRRCALPRTAGGGFAYFAAARVGGDHDANAPRTAMGIVVLEDLRDAGKEADPSPEVIAGGDYLLAHPLKDPNQGFYFDGVYFASLAFERLGGKYRETGAPRLREALLAARNAEGFWPKGGGFEMEAGDAYRTSLAVLALCAPYDLGRSHSKHSPGTNDSPENASSAPRPE